jgi:spore germination protein YaaH
MSTGPGGTLVTSTSRTVLAWVTPDDASIKSAARYSAALISPVLFRLDWGERDARLSPWSARAPKLIDQLRTPKLQLVPLVSCLGPCAKRLSLALADESARNRLFDTLAVAATAYGGLAIDFEDLRCEATFFSEIVRSLAGALHKVGKRLVVTAPPPCGAGEPKEEWRTCAADGSSYDFVALVNQADLLAVMLYDHDTSGERAPQGKAFVAGSLDRLANLVPAELRERVLVGVPLYGRMSASLTGRTDVLFGAASRGHVQGHTAQVSALRFDADALAGVGTITLDDDATRSGKIFLETHESVRARLQLTHARGFGGIALWRLGDEDPCVASVVSAFAASERLDGACP